MTSYNEVFNLALRLYDDPSLSTWSEDDLIKELYGHLEDAIYRLPQLRSETSERDSLDLEDIETKGFSNTLSDTTKMALALSMKCSWLEPQLDSVMHTLQSFNRREGYSQAEHLKALQSRYDAIRTEIQKLLRDDSYVSNDYFD